MFNILSKKKKTLRYVFTLSFTVWYYIRQAKILYLVVIVSIGGGVVEWLVSNSGCQIKALIKDIQTNEAEFMFTWCKSLIVRTLWSLSSNCAIPLTVNSSCSFTQSSKIVCRLFTRISSINVFIYNNYFDMFWISLLYGILIQ